MYCHVTGIVFWLLFPFNSSRALHKIIQKCSCFLFLLYAVLHWSHNWNRESNTIWVNSSLLLNTINQFQILFKTRFTTKTPGRDYLSPFFATSPLAKSPCPEHFIHQTRMFFVVLSSFWKLKNRLWRCNSVFTTTLGGTFISKSISRFSTV